MNEKGNIISCIPIPDPETISEKFNYTLL